MPKRNTKGTEPGLALPAREGGMSSAAGAPQLPGEEGDRSQDVWQWMLESERQSKSKPHSTQSIRKSYPLESARAPPGERVSRHHLLGASGHPRSAARAHPFTQDPAMPPLTPPNTLAQLGGSLPQAGRGVKAPETEVLRGQSAEGQEPPSHRSGRTHILLQPEPGFRRSQRAKETG